MNGEKITNNPGNDSNNWGSLENLPPFAANISGWTKTESGILLPPSRKKPQAETVETPVVKEQMEAQDDSTVESTPTEEQTGLMVDDLLSEHDTADSKSTNTENTNITDESAAADEVSAAPEAPHVIEAIPFIQSTDEAKILEKDPSYFVFLPSAERGYAVKRDEAIQYYKEGMAEAKSDNDIWKMIRMERDILNSTGKFSDEEKQEVKDFASTLDIYGKKLNYEIRRNQMILKRGEETVKRCEAECASYDKMNIVSKFLNRYKIDEVRARYNNAVKHVETIKGDIRRLESELRELNLPNESAQTRDTRKATTATNDNNWNRAA